MGLASYPGLLTTAFVTCSTNAGEGLAKLITCNDITWTCGGVAFSFCIAVKQLSETKKCHQDCLMLSTQSFYHPCLKSLAHSLTCDFSRNAPLLHTSGYIIARDQFYQAFPCISTASDRCWGEKAWVRGYNGITYRVFHQL